MQKSFVTIILTAIVHCSAVPAFSEVVRIPGTTVSLTPPQGFSLAQEYPGFEREAEQASIMVTELPGPATAMIQAMNRQALASRGMLLVAAHDVVVKSRPARLLNVRQQTAHVDLLKWMLITGDDTITIMVVGTFPASSPQSTANSIRHSLLTTSWGSAAPPNEFEGLPFRVEPTSKLKLARRVSNMLMFTESGTMGSASTEALYVVGHSIGQGPVGDLRTFSESRALQTTLIKAVRTFAGRRVQVDGLDAYELEADAIDARGETPMRLYQVVIADETRGYFIIQGLSRADRAGELLPEFKAITTGFRRTSR